VAYYWDQYVPFLQSMLICRNWIAFTITTLKGGVGEDWGTMLQCSSDISEPKYTCTRNSRQPNTHIRVWIYAYTRIRIRTYAYVLIRVCLISMYELTY